MNRRFVADLIDKESIDQVYLASQKQLRPDREGNLYLQVRLSDKSGSTTAMLWNAEKADFDRFNNGDFVRVRGKAQLYNGSMQIIARKFKQVDSGSVDESDFVTISADELERMVNSVGEMLRSMQSFPLRMLAECFLADAELMNRFRRAPAGIKNHHAFQGGLLQHVEKLMKLALSVTPHYEQVDGDVVLMGAFLHDIGKIDELTYSPDLGYSDEGQLVGHLVQGVSILEQKISEVSAQPDMEKFPVDLALHLKHMIVSHHGPAEYGSPKVPMTLEAVLLHYLDNIDAKIATITRLIDEDPNDGKWTVYHPHLGRKIFKPATLNDNGSTK